MIDILSEHATCFAIQALPRRGGGFEPPLIRGVPFWGSWRMAKIKFGEFQFRRGREANYLGLQLTVLN
jgi:hypothetical protein